MTDCLLKHQLATTDYYVKLSEPAWICKSSAVQLLLILQNDNISGQLTHLRGSKCFQVVIKSCAVSRTLLH